MAIAYLFVTCADCGAEVDRLEYEPDTPAPAVQTVADQLGLGLDEARKLVKRHNPGAELASEETVRALADAIVAGSVDGRPAEADRCPAGHDAGLRVQSDNPTPAVVLAIRRVNA